MILWWCVGVGGVVFVDCCWWCWLCGLVVVVVGLCECDGKLYVGWFECLYCNVGKYVVVDGC